ncbi:hypothetical protein ABH926_007739 [Catenulispora sp. GP43]
MTDGGRLGDQADRDAQISCAPPYREQGSNPCAVQESHPGQVHADPGRLAGAQMRVKGLHESVRGGEIQFAAYGDDGVNRTPIDLVDVHGATAPSSRARRYIGDEDQVQSADQTRYSAVYGAGVWSVGNDSENTAGGNTM